MRGQPGASLFFGRLGKIGAPLLVIVALGACGSITPGAQDVERAAQFFEEIAFRAVGHSSIEKWIAEPVPNRFDGVISVRIEGVASVDPDKFTEYVRAAFAWVTEETGLAIEISDATRMYEERSKVEEFDGAITTIFVPVAEIAKDSLCTATNFHDGPGRTIGSVIQISTRREVGGGRPAREIIQCLNHEIMRALGFGGHQLVSRVRSVLGGHPTELGTRPAWPTEWDLLVIRTLYDGRLVRGMPRQQAAPIIRAIIAEQIAEQIAARN